MVSNKTYRFWDLCEVIHSDIKALGFSKLRQRLHGTGSVWNRYKIGMDNPCVYTGPDGSGADRICYLVPNGSTFEGDPMWNPTVPVYNQSRVNRVNPYHSRSDPKRI